eukprot:1159022-Pelagomonas_calceolata.AAC.5
MPDIVLHASMTCTTPLTHSLLSSPFCHCNRELRGTPTGGCQAGTQHTCVAQTWANDMLAFRNCQPFNCAHFDAYKPEGDNAKQCFAPNHFPFCLLSQVTVPSNTTDVHQPPVVMVQCGKCGSLLEVCIPSLPSQPTLTAPYTQPPLSEDPHVLAHSTDTPNAAENNAVQLCAPQLALSCSNGGQEGPQSDPGVAANNT